MKRLATIFLVIFALSTAAQAERFRHLNRGQPARSKAATLKCTTVTDINTLNDILYKSSNLHGGRCGTWLDQDHRLGGSRTLRVAGTNKTIFGCFGLYACDRPYGCRYYQRMCGTCLSKSQIAAKARANGGTTTAYVGNGNGRCYSFNANTDRYGRVRK